jgi:hypothetical protein
LVKHTGTGSIYAFASGWHTNSAGTAIESSMSPCPKNNEHKYQRGGIKRLIQHDDIWAKSFSAE